MWAVRESMKTCFHQRVLHCDTIVPSAHTILPSEPASVDNPCNLSDHSAWGLHNEYHWLWSLCVCMWRLVISRLLVLLLASFVVRRQLSFLCTVFPWPSLTVQRVF